MGGRDEYMLNGKRRREADDDNGSLFAAFLAFFFFVLSRVDPPGSGAVLQS